MKLVVGLGNPGRKYDGTRHNVGFRTLDELTRRWNAAKPKAAFSGEVTEVNVGSERVLLVWPHTFMNRSGASLLAARDFYKLENSAVLVVCDDFNLPLGKLRIRTGGSAGGQKGLADIVRCLGTEEVPRLRIGIGPVPDAWQGADFVLGKFTKSEQPVVDETIVRAAEAVEVWARSGLAQCMNQFNA